MSLARLPLRVRLVIAACLGGLGVLAFAPFHFGLLLVPILASFYELLAGRPGREGGWLGWAFGLGLFGGGVSWIRISLNEFGNLGVWPAQLLTLVFILVMAGYYAVLGGLTARLSRRAPRSAPWLVFPALWTGLEWLRGWVLTGFPWLHAGDAQLETPLAGFAPLVGVYGLSLLTALSAGLLWGLWRRRGRERQAAAAVLGAIWLAGYGLQEVEWSRPVGAPVRAAVIQANIPQAMKWREELRVPTLRAYVELTRKHYDSAVIVWPETAVPDFLEQVRGPFLAPLAEEVRAQGAHLVLGIPFLNPERGTYYNGLLSLGAREDLYAKRHLVPFGEFLPFRQFLAPLAMAFAVPLADFSAGTAARPLLRVGPHQVGVSICYEDAFAAEVAQALPEAAYLINVSNDAWFGDSLAPHQHLAIARMRALENRRWLLRATNTGISAILDARGRVVGRIPPFTRGGLSAEIEARTGATPFSRVGHALALGLAALMLAAAWLEPRRWTKVPPPAA